eukprot:gene15316-biopygen11385
MGVMDWEWAVTAGACPAATRWAIATRVHRSSTMGRARGTPDIHELLAEFRRLQAAEGGAGRGAADAANDDAAFAATLHK